MKVKVNMVVRCCMIEMARMIAMPLTDNQSCVSPFRCLDISDGVDQCDQEFCPKLLPLGRTIAMMTLIN